MKDIYKGKKVTIMGLGLQGSGISAAKFFIRQGAKVTVTDIKTKERLKSALDKLTKFKEIKYVLGQHRPEDFFKADLIIKGPGVPNDSKYLEIARKNNVPVDTEAGIFFKIAKNLIIGVTGTRGKSTTTQLIYELLKNAKKEVLIGGNIKGRPLMDLHKDLKKDDWLVLELSSFQLEGVEIHRKSPHIAVVTNFMMDHLDRYKGVEAYHESKKTIVKYQSKDDYAVLNYDDEAVRSLAKEIRSVPWFFSINRLGGDKVVYVFEGKIYYRNGAKEELLLDLEKLKLIGKHRISNILAAVCVGLILKIDPEIIRKTIIEFNGIEHRLEVVKEVAGVLYVNDTCATIPEASVMALRSFKNPIILIAGGSTKKLDFSLLAEEIINWVKNLVLIPGSGTDELLASINQQKEVLGKKAPEIKMAEDMETAVKLSSVEAVEGDTVLLSPGCSSFGIFENEFERGDRFKEAVSSL